MVAVGAHQAPVGGHELDRPNVIGGKTVLAAEEAQSAAERVADDTHVRGGAGQRSEPVPRRRADHLTRQHASLDPGDAPDRVDRETAHPLGLEQNRVAHRSKRGGPVSRCLGGYPLPPLSGKQDRSGDVLRGLRKHNGRRVLVDCQVPRAARRIEAPMLGGHDLACQCRRKPARPTGCSGKRVHVNSFRFVDC